LKINRLLAATLALVLIAGLGTPAFAQSLPEGSTSSTEGSTSSSMVFTPNHGNVDQSNIVPFGGEAFVGPDFGPAGQSFTPTASNLVGVDVFVNPFPSTNLGGPETVTVNVWDTGVPGTGNLLGSSTVNINTVGSTTLNPLLVHLDFSLINLIPGNMFALEFIITSSSNNVFADGPDTYSGGTGFQLGNPIGDFIFATYFDEVVGGELLPIETTSLLLAGAQSFSWMIPVIVSVIGIGLFVVSRKSE